MSIVNTASDIFADMVSGTVGPIAAAGASLAEQTFTDNTVEELKANNEKYNDFLNYAPRTEGGKEANQSFKDTIGEGAAAVVDYYKENEEDIPDSVKSAVSSAVDTWNDLDEEARFALGNLATVAEVLPMGKAASLAKKGIDNATDARRINNAASEVPDESAYLPVQERLGAMGARQEMAAEVTPIQKTADDFQDEGTYYRVVVGDTSFQDIVDSGEVRTNASSKKTSKADGKIDLSSRPTRWPSFSKDSASMNYAGKNEDHYIVVTNDPSIQPSKQGRHGKGTTQFPTDANGNPMESLSGDAISVYKHTGNGNYELAYNRGQEMAKPVNPTVAKNSEGKLLDINEFNGVTRLGADGTKLDTNMRATSYVATKEEIAATKKDRKDWKNTPEAKSKSTLNQEKIDAPTREEWRTRNKKANKQPRDLELRDAAAKSMANE